MLTWVTVSVPPRMLPPAEPLTEPEPLAPDPVEPEALAPVEPEPVEPEPVEPAPVEPEPVEPEPVEPDAPALLEPEPDEEPEPLGDEELLIDDPLAPPKRPVTITWCPTCCDRLTELSADRRMSDPPRPLMLPPRPAVDEEPSLPDVEPEAEAPEPVEPEPVEPDPVAPAPVEPEPVEPEPDADEPAPAEPVEPELDVDAPEPELDPEPELMLDPLPLPMRAFFSTKLPLPPPELLADALLVSLLLELVLEPSARCRQPVAVIEPAVDDVWLLSDELDCAAASAPHNATLLLSVIAHCQ